MAAIAQKVTPAIGRKPRRISWFNISAVVLTLVLAALFFFPLCWAIVGALKKPNELQVIPPLLYPPDPQWQNFVEVGKVIPFYRYVWNTLVITVFGSLGGLISASLVGYGFACFRFRGRTFLFIVLLATMVLPGEVTLIPTYIRFVNYLGWGNTILPLVVPSYFGGGAFSIFLFRQFFASIPKDLNDAAKIDGCGPLRYYLIILIPLSMPVIITLAILWFQFYWNDLMGPLIYLTDQDKSTITTGLLALRSTLGGTFARRGAAMDHLLMAGSLIGMLPSILIFFALQRYFIRGVIMTGIKG
ncbi:MAG TPA: carbohydrate ABC transporter permease [Caldilineaceae bacterium]|nr:carbohydrate ABC transporter permease [Caldilineaceae bacterium]